MIRFVTGNANKVLEIKKHVPDVEQLELDLPEVQGVDAQAIVHAKLIAARERTDDELIVEDTSLELDCLGGLPGPLIKWFVSSIGPDGIADLALRYDERGATARTIIGYSNGTEMRFFEGSVRGSIVSPRGPPAFGWDPIFEPEGYDRTYSELGEEKHAMSHRARAVEKLVEFLHSRS